MVTIYTAQARINSSSGRVGLPSTEEVSFFPQMNVLESGCVNYPISSATVIQVLSLCMIHVY